MSYVEVTVIVNDESVKPKLKTMHGLSLLIEAYGRVILFDLGPSSEALQYNADLLGVDLSLVDALVISHLHSDHVGGAPYLGWIAPSTKSYLPYATGCSFTQYIRRNGLNPVEVLDWIQVYPGVHISKSIHGPPWEQSLVIETPSGNILFTGCCHPGLETLVSEVERKIGKVRAVIGGLHLSRAPTNVVERAAVYLLSKRIVSIPLHCSGRELLEYLNKVNPSLIIKAGAGSQIAL
ncbi:MAG: MBL fold metallo-hydrolase [Sulfolobales archaeon]|nr:MBL fold metallo-hydrolase [Sulfolobales archaeon]MCX8199079.1 MBL fold metallo-hydrolase [Sulfolobales archaeon]MDW8170058.1 MBL fold metallo-hydrolase [Desulfurococcaceae archaeon]